jgi:hypothetical protein
MTSTFISNIETSPIVKRRRIYKYDQDHTIHWMESKNFFYIHLFLDDLETHFQRFIFHMNIPFEVKYKYTFFDLEKKHCDVETKQYFKHQKMLNSHLSSSFTINNKIRLQGSSLGKIYIDSDSTVSQRKLYKVFNMAGFFLEIFHEAFIGYMLYTFFPNAVPQIYEIGKFEKIISTPVKKKYIYFSQTYFKNGTYLSLFDSFSFQEHLYYLIKVSEHIEKFQRTLDFIHCDLKTNNFCISDDRKSVSIIDFGYSSFDYQSNHILTDLSLSYDQFVKDKTFETFSDNRVLTQNIVRSDKYKFSGDLFYLIYSVLYHHLHEPSDIIRNQKLYDTLHSLFDVHHKTDNVINIFDKMYELNQKSFDFIGFFMSKDSSMLIHYFGDNIVNIDEFYERFLPTRLISHLEYHLKCY